jgi:hypothetical protein
MNVVRLDRPSVIVAPLDPLEPSVAFECRDLCAGSQDDLRIFLDAANQISRHRVGKTLPTD